MCHCVMLRLKCLKSFQMLAMTHCFLMRHRCVIASSDCRRRRGVRAPDDDRAISFAFPKQGMTTVAWITVFDPVRGSH